MACTTWAGLHINRLTANSTSSTSAFFTEASVRMPMQQRDESYEVHCCRQLQAFLFVAGGLRLHGSDS